MNNFWNMSDARPSKLWNEGPHTSYVDASYRNDGSPVDDMEKMRGFLGLSNELGIDAKFPRSGSVKLHPILKCG